MPLARVRTIWGGSVVGGGVTNSYFLVTPLDVTTAQQCIDAMRDFWTGCNTIISTGTNWTVSATVQEVDPVTGLVVAEFGVIARNGAGTAAGDRLPPSNQGLLRLSTGTFVAGRRIQGHWNIPGAVEAANDPGGTPSAGYLAALGAAANTLNALVNPTLHVFSRTRNQSAPVASVTPVGIWAVLRSRRD